MKSPYWAHNGIIYDLGPPPADELIRLLLLLNCINRRLATSIEYK